MRTNAVPCEQNYKNREWNLQMCNCSGCSIYGEDDSSKCDIVTKRMRLSERQTWACNTGRDDGKGNGLSPGVGLTLREKVLLAVTVVFGALLIALAVTVVVLRLKLSKKNSSCTSNCIECDEDKCSSCEQNYKLESGICRCATVDRCSICAEDDSSKCDTCDEGLRLSEDNSACITGRDDGNGLSPGAIFGIIIAIIVVAILLALLTALIIFLAKRYWDKVTLRQLSWNLDLPTDPSKVTSFHVLFILLCLLHRTFIVVLVM
ncbi:hypothetical protein GBAR_LOCUS8666 [Geodia barretti]|uniref:Uncharacterized protein n=1 Tax=Geodia barretti TaxID=519541 RepID=A0AA35WGR5_GEOBA|nr:hypothetical protein GBAR_LOCUS8666 [Geodia barretti]